MIVIVQCVGAAAPPVVASFTATPTSGVAPLTVQFTDTSTGNPTYRHWYFGEYLVESTEPNPSHTFQAGTYTVTLFISNTTNRDYIPDQTISSTSQTIVVREPPGPTVSFTSNPSSGKIPFTVQFTDTSTFPQRPEDITDKNWQWAFGDGGTSTLQNPVHTYNTYMGYACNPGSHVFPVTLVVRGKLSNYNGGLYGQSSNYISLVDISPAVVSAFTSTATSGPAPLTVQFTDTSSNNPTSWSWNFGDGTYLNLQNPSHTYSISGVYTVQMSGNSPTTCNPVTKTTTITVLSPLAPTTSSTLTPTQTTTTATTIAPNTTITTASTSTQTTKQTTGVTTVPTTSQTTITTTTPTRTATVNYSATIAAMQSQIVEQNARITEQGNILDQIMTFLRNVFGLK